MLLLVFNLETEHAVNQESYRLVQRGCFMYGSDMAQWLPWWKAFGFMVPPLQVVAANMYIFGST